MLFHELLQAIGKVFRYFFMTLPLPPFSRPWDAREREVEFRLFLPIMGPPPFSSFEDEKGSRRGIFLPP